MKESKYTEASALLELTMCATSLSEISDLCSTNVKPPQPLKAFCSLTGQVLNGHRWSDVAPEVDIIFSNFAFFLR